MVFYHIHLIITFDTYSTIHIISLLVESQVDCQDYWKCGNRNPPDSFTISSLVINDMALISVSHCASFWSIVLWDYGRGKNESRRTLSCGRCELTQRNIRNLPHFGKKHCFIFNVWTWCDNIKGLLRTLLGTQENTISAASTRRRLRLQFRVIQRRFSSTSSPSLLSLQSSRSRLFDLLLLRPLSPPPPLRSRLRERLRDLKDGTGELSDFR